MLKAKKRHFKQIQYFKLNLQFEKLQLNEK